MSKLYVPLYVTTAIYNFNSTVSVTMDHLRSLEISRQY